MENNHDDIDQILFNQLGDASMDGEGIDWNAFNHKRKKRRAAIWWKLAFVGLLILSGVILVKFDLGRNEKMKMEVSQFKITSKTEVKDIEVENKSRKIEKITGVVEENMNTSGDDIDTKNSHNIEVEAETKQKVEPAKSNEIIEQDIETEQNSIKADNSSFVYDEITLVNKEIPNLFVYIKPHYMAEKISDNLKEPPVFNIKKLKLYWEIQAGPSLNVPNFKVTPTGKAYIHKDYESIRKLSETAVSGYNLQMAVGTTVKRWSYSVGLGFTSFNMLGDYNFSYSEKPVIDTDGKIKDYLKSTPEGVQFTSRQNLSFIEIPVSIQYMIVDKPKFGAGLRLGYVNQFLTRIAGQLPNAVFLDEREKMTTENFKLRTSSIQGGIQFLYKINQNSSIILMPEYRRGLGFNQVQSFYKTNFNYWGLNLNYRMGL